MAPPWLCGYDTNGEKFLYLIGLALDMLIEKSVEGQTAKMPGQGSDPSVLPLQAADRVLAQGPGESNAAFTERLEDAFNAWGKAGSRVSVLGQIQAYLTNAQPGVALAWPECLIVGGNTSLTTWDTIYGSTPSAGAPAHALIDPANWNWDGLNRPTRAWLVLFMNLVATGQAGTAATVASIGGSGVAGVTDGFATITGLSGMTGANVQQYLVVTGAATSANNGTFQIVAVSSSTSVIIANTAAIAGDANDGAIVWHVGAYPYIGPGPVWGSPDFVWGDDLTWGLNCSPLVIESIRAILKAWKAASTYYPNIIISFGGADSTAGSEFSPNSVQGNGNPDGTWADYGRNVGGCWIPAPAPKNPFTAVCDGTGLAINCYEKNTT